MKKQAYWRGFWEDLFNRKIPKINAQYEKDNTALSSLFDSQVSHFESTTPRGWGAKLYANPNDIPADANPEIREQLQDFYVSMPVEEPSPQLIQFLQNNPDFAAKYNLDAAQLQNDFELLSRFGNQVDPKNPRVVSNTDELMAFSKRMEALNNAKNAERQALRDAYDKDKELLLQKYKADSDTALKQSAKAMNAAIATGGVAATGLGAGLAYGLREKEATLYDEMMGKTAEEKEKSSNDYLAGAGIGSLVGKKMGAMYDAPRLMGASGRQRLTDIGDTWQSGQKGKAVLKGLGMMKGTLIGSGAGALSGLGLAHVLKNRDIPRNPDGTPKESWLDNVNGTTVGLAAGLGGAGYGALTGVGREQGIRERLESTLNEANQQVQKVQGSDLPDALNKATFQQQMAQADLDQHKLLYGDTATTGRSRLVNAAGKGIGAGLTGAILGYGVNRFANMGKDKPSEETLPKEASDTNNSFSPVMAGALGLSGAGAGLSVGEAINRFSPLTADEYAARYALEYPNGTVNHFLEKYEEEKVNRIPRNRLRGAGLGASMAIVPYAGYHTYQGVQDYLDLRNAGRERLNKTAGTWTRKEGQNPEGGLNQKGRDSYNRETGGNLKRPVSKEEAGKSDKAASRRKSFCARMSGMKKRLTSAETARDPDSRINKALRKWDC